MLLFAPPNRVMHQGGAGGQSKLPLDVAPMDVDRFAAEVQGVGDLIVVPALPDEPVDFELTARELLKRGT